MVQVYYGTLIDDYEHPAPWYTDASIGTEHYGLFQSNSTESILLHTTFEVAQRYDWYKPCISGTIGMDEYLGTIYCSFVVKAAYEDPEYTSNPYVRIAFLRYLESTLGDLHQIESSTWATISDTFPLGPDNTEWSENVLNQSTLQLMGVSNRKKDPVEWVYSIAKVKMFKFKSIAYW